MTQAMLRESIDMLLQEAYEGPAKPDAPWFVNNNHDGGVLGTLRHLTLEQAWYKPDGLAHSVAEHVSHILFSLNHAMKCATCGQETHPDWEDSWDCGPPDEGHWQTMQRHLRESHLRLRMWVHGNETFTTKESIARLIGVIAHAAYHLGALRQVAVLASHEAPAEDPLERMARPL